MQDTVYTELKKVHLKFDSANVTMELKAVPLWWLLWIASACSHVLSPSWLHLHAPYLRKRALAIAFAYILALYGTIYKIHQRMGEAGYWASEREEQFALASKEPSWFRSSSGSSSQETVQDTKSA